MNPVHLWKDGTRYLLRTSPQPHLLRYGNDPYVEEESEVKDELLMKAKENSTGARKIVFFVFFFNLQQLETGEAK